MDVQTTIVFLMIGVAASYGLIQVYGKLVSTTSAGSCEAGCGKCKTK
jgi:hypothetical protein